MTPSVTLFIIKARFVVSHKLRETTFFSLMDFLYLLTMHADGLNYMKRRLHHMCKQTAIKLFCMEQHNEGHYCNCGG